MNFFQKLFLTLFFIVLTNAGFAQNGTTSVTVTPTTTDVPYTFANASATFTINLSSLYAWAYPGGWAIAVAQCPLGSSQVNGFTMGSFTPSTLNDCICNRNQSSCPSYLENSTVNNGAGTAVTTVMCQVNMEGWFNSPTIDSFLTVPPGVALSNSIFFGNFLYSGVVGGGPAAVASWSSVSGVIPSYDFTSADFTPVYSGTAAVFNACCCSTWSGANCDKTC